MKKLTLISSAIAVVLLFTLSSCGVSNKSVAQHDDMYYSPSAAKQQARIDDRNRKRELAEREANGEFEQTPGTSFQSSSNNNEGGNQNSANYEDEYRMNYGSYFSRFGNGYHHNPYMRQPRMMYSPGFSFWTGYNNFGMGYGMGYGNPMMMGGYYDPFCPWGGGMGMGMMGYNPYYMNPYMGMGMGGFGMNPYNSGFMTGYMYGSMAGGSNFGGGGGSSFNQRPQPVIARRQSYGSNQSVVNRNRNSAAYGTSNSPNTNNTVQSRGTSTGTATRGSSTPSDRRTSTTPARTTVRGSGSSPTPSRSTAPAPTRTPSRSYNQPAPRTPSSPSYNAPSRGGSGGGRSTGGSSGGSSGGGSRGGRR